MGDTTLVVEENNDEDRFAVGEQFEWLGPSFRIVRVIEKPKKDPEE